MTEVLRLRRGDVDAREGALRLTNLKQRRRAPATTALRLRRSVRRRG